MTMTGTTSPTKASHASAGSTKPNARNGKGTNASAPAIHALMRVRPGGVGRSEMRTEAPTNEIVSSGPAITTSKTTAFVRLRLTATASMTATEMPSASARQKCLA